MIDIKTGDVLEGRIADFASGGEGVLKIDKYPIFVPFVLEGETARVRVTYVKKDCAFGELVEIIEQSEDRVKPVCPYFGRCGGCDLQHANIEYQLRLKRETVRGALKKIAGIEADVPLPIEGKSFAYRNKLALPFAQNRVSGRVYLGFYERRSHRAVPIKWCATCGPWAADVIEILTDWANKFGISVYDEASGKGLLRHAVARMLDSLSLTVVVNGEDIPYQRELEKALREKFPDFCLYACKNTKRTNAIFGDTVKKLCGEERPQNLGKVSAVTSPKAFLQVNNEMRDALYDGVAEALNGFDGTLIELYSGAGILTAQLATRLNVRIVSVEIEPSASKNAADLMKKLGLEDRVKCVTDDAMRFMIGLKSIEGRRALILDPPRRGCDREVLERAMDVRFERIAYASCEPQTLARDAAILKEKYAIEAVRTYDMFPQTAGVETLVVFARI